MIFQRGKESEIYGINLSEQDKILMDELKPVEVTSDPNISKIYSIIQLNNTKIASKVEANQGKILPGFTEILQYGLLTFIRNTIDELIKISF